MRLNQVTLAMPDVDAGLAFYRGLGLRAIVDARPRYVRLLCPDGDTTLSLHLGQGGGGTTIYFECDALDEEVRRLEAAGYAFSGPPVDQSWLWREAELFDPGGNRVLLYFAGANRIDPPWRVREDGRLQPAGGAEPRPAPDAAVGDEAGSR